MNPNSQTNAQNTDGVNKPAAGTPQMVESIPVQHSEPTTQPASPAPNPIADVTSPIQRAQFEQPEGTNQSKAAVQVPAKSAHHSKLGLTIFTAICVAALLGFMAYLVFRQS